MAGVSLSVALGAPTDEVWRVIGGFQSLAEWHPAIDSATAEEDGRVRRLSIAGGATIVERLVNHDDHARRYSYCFVEAPLPVANYHSTIAVDDDGNGACVVTWSGEFEADGVTEGEAESIVAGIYQAGLDSLKTIFS